MKRRDSPHAAERTLSLFGKPQDSHERRSLRLQPFGEKEEVGGNFLRGGGGGGPGGDAFCTTPLLRSSGNNCGSGSVEVESAEGNKTLFGLILIRARARGVFRLGVGSRARCGLLHTWTS